MKYELLKYLLLLTLSGCSTFNGMRSSIVNNYEAGRKLSSARQEIENGKTASAINLFEEIVNSSSVTGVTDEALFRLSLLKLGHEDKEFTSSSLRYLERLRSDYPASSWTQQSRPLYDFLKGTSEIKRHNRNLKLLNISLTRDNKDLRQSIDRLKSLDMKLER